ncbi:MAG: hypothetical protein H0V89_08375, partial [Deltaproteobacteria bacterium]|nr:hypothetical protein [Deltaproteobacteria bacterium]
MRRTLVLGLLFSCAQPSAPDAAPGDISAAPASASSPKAPAEASPWMEDEGQLPPPGDCVGTVSDTLTCTTDRVGQVISTDGNDVFGNYSCGLPNGPSLQDGPDLVWEFVCPSTGNVVIDWYGLDCDIDLYVLDDTCDGDFGCVAGANDGDIIPGRLDWMCTEGLTYYLVIEGWGYGQLAANGGCSPMDTEGNFTVTVDTAASSACIEICDDGIDNNADGLTDCDDLSCVGDPACAGIESCMNGVDDDLDGLDDCDDVDCPDSDLDG